MNNQHNGSSRGSRLGPFDYRSAADRLINYAPYANAANNNNNDDDDEDEANEYGREDDDEDDNYQE